MSNAGIPQQGLGAGQVVAGRYEIIEPIGKGGMGVVYRVLDRELDDDQVALKLLHAHLANEEQIFRRFRNEVLVARSLTHPNIVRIHDIGKDDRGFFYISMEYVDGISLKERIALGQTEVDETQRLRSVLSFDESLIILSQVVSGVAYAHTRGIIHRDLKPANILIGKEGEVKLADFGTARILRVDTALTQEGQVIGTPDYMSPEQIRGEVLDYACDIYSLGIIGYELVVGVKPFQADSAVAVAFKHLNEPIPPFQSDSIGIPQWYEDCVRKATEKDRDARYGSALEFLQDMTRHEPSLMQQTGMFSVDSTSMVKMDSATTKSVGLQSSSANNDGGFELGSSSSPQEEDSWSFDSGESANRSSGASHKRPGLREKEEKQSIIGLFFALIFLALVGGAAVVVVGPKLGLIEEPVWLAKLRGVDTEVAGMDVTETDGAPMDFVTEDERKALEEELLGLSDSPTPDSAGVKEENVELASSGTRTPEPVVEEKSVVAPKQPAVEKEVAEPEPENPKVVEPKFSLQSARFALVNREGSVIPDTIREDRLGTTYWTLAIDGSFEGDARRAKSEYLKKLDLQVLDENKKRVVSLTPSSSEIVSGSNGILVKGSLSAIGRSRYKIGSFDLEAALDGSVLDSKQFSVYGAGPRKVVSNTQAAGINVQKVPSGTVRKEEPSEVESNPSVSPRLPSSANADRLARVPTRPPRVASGLPSAAGYKRGAEPASRLENTQSYNKSSLDLSDRQLKEAAQSLNIPRSMEQPVAPSAAGAEVYQGTLSMNDESGAKVSRKLTLNITIAGRQIAGSAEIEGMGTFAAGGKMFPRGLEINLRSGEIWFRLSGAKRDATLRGRYYFSEGEERGPWSATLK